ncbi:MAG TPA: hypothetical protein VMU84_20485 [Thermoanaerobaculia bacterium]|nr:hypothetical protein [Thermoanaerobaculia bacterium]
MIRKSFPLLCSVLALSLSIGGCKQEETTTPSTAAPESLAKSAPTPPVPTVSPTMLPDVNPPLPGVEENLPWFDDFSWREFIALTWPAQTSGGPSYTRGVPNTTKPYGDVSGPLVFATWKNDYELFLPNGDPPAPWNSYASPSPCGGSLQPYPVILGSFNKYHGFNEAAFGVDTGPLISQNKQYTRYQTAMNEPQYNFIINPGSPYPGPLYLVKNLPGTGTNPPLKFTTGSIEIKAAWRVLTNVPAAQRARYYVTSAQLLDPVTGRCTATDVGLAGLHIVNKTAKFPNWVWSTFEQVDNVPAIAGETPVSSGPYGYNDPSQPQKLSKVGQPIDKCNPPVANPTPTQVIRLQPINKSTQNTNNAYRNLAGVKGTVWENYQLTLTQWPINNGTDTFPNATTPAPPTNTANTVAETWYQKSSLTTCMACHAISQAQGDDFVFFLPLGAYPQPDDPCKAVSAFTKAQKPIPMAKGPEAAAPDGQDKVVESLQKFFKEHPPGNE